MRGSCETAGYGNGPLERGSLASLAALAVHVEQRLGLGVIRLELVVSDGPGRREAVDMADLPEVAFAQPEQRGAVDLRIAADVVVQPGMELRPPLSNQVSVAW